MEIGIWKFCLIDKVLIILVKILEKNLEEFVCWDLEKCKRYLFGIIFFVGGFLNVLWDIK